MSKPNKKQRHKTRREAKRREIRRRDSISPVKRLADAPGEMECWMSNTLAQQGQTHIMVYKRAAGLTGVACFLIDRGVAGLKDAYIRMKIDRKEFSDMVEISTQRGIEMVRVSVDQIRAIVAGAVRWTSRNGLRLPKDWAKFASVFGGVGDWESADTSAFIMEFAGHPADLRKRLIGEPFDSYIQRKDIAFVFSNNAPHDDDGYSSGEFDDGLADDWDDDDKAEEDEIETKFEAAISSLEEQFAPVAFYLAGETGMWLSARDLAPIQELSTAWRMFIVARMLSAGFIDEKTGEERNAASIDSALELLTRRVPESAFAAYTAALDRVLEHLASDPSLIVRAIDRIRLAEPPTDGGLAADTDGITEQPASQ